MEVLTWGNILPLNPNIEKNPAGPGFTEQTMSPKSYDNIWKQNFLLLGIHSVV